jgi:circadian clock protein KaiB
MSKPRVVKKTPLGKTSARLRVQANGGAQYELCLYVAGNTQRSSVALANLKRICIDHLRGEYRVKVIDLLKKPALARGDQILAIPTLVRRLPPPIRKIIGDLSDTDRVLVGLDLKPHV